jgi:hypothetical protein
MRSDVSILFNNAQDVPDEGPSEEPTFLGDLVNTATASRS